MISVTNTVLCFLSFLFIVVTLHGLAKLVAQMNLKLIHTTNLQTREKETGKCRITTTQI